MVLIDLSLRAGSAFHPLAAIGREQMQFFARRNRPDSLADGRTDRAGDAHDHFARLMEECRPIAAAVGREL